jgi:hypothetical protein
MKRVASPFRLLATSGWSGPNADSRISIERANAASASANLPSSP